MICPTCKRTFDRGGDRRHERAGDHERTRGRTSDTDSAPGESIPNNGPFCSARCRLADLGSWLSGSYRIGSPASEEDLDTGLSADDDTVN
jgi:endogenous inhibitor of DNA gyrase (YacG/DUF329 family)